MKLTALQKLWLNSRGDRTIEDVLQYKDKFGIFMRYQNEDAFVEIPKDEDILKEYEIIKRVKTSRYSPLVLTRKR